MQGPLTLMARPHLALRGLAPSAGRPSWPAHPTEMDSVTGRQMAPASVPLDGD